jgi:hypothetical protein
MQFLRSGSLVVILMFAARCGSSDPPGRDSSVDTGVDAGVDGGGADMATSTDSADMAGDRGVGTGAGGEGGTSDRPPASEGGSPPDRSADQEGGAASGCGCGADEVCVVVFDGTCQMLGGTSCVKKTASCQAAMCNSGCDLLCNPGDAGPPRFTCSAAPCPTSSQFPNAVLCYGP